MSGLTLAAGLRDALLPSTCAICTEPLAGPGRGICGACWATVVPDSEGRCERCGAPLEPSEPLCLACSTDPPPQDGTVVWGSYEGTLRRAILALKHHGHDELARPLGRRLAALADTAPWERKPACVVPVPTHPVHRIRRGWSAAELLAGEVAATLGLPLERRLRRHGLGRQATRSRARRRQLPARAFTARGRGRSSGDAVLLVDDVMATGATLRRAVGALRRGGIETVYVAVLAAAS